MDEIEEFPDYEIEIEFGICCNHCGANMLPEEPTFVGEPEVTDMNTKPGYKVAILGLVSFKQCECIERLKNSNEVN